MAIAQEALEAARGYLFTHPEEVTRAMRSALGLRVGVPIVALRWFGKQLEKSGKVSDLKLDSVPPGLKASAGLDLMNTPLRASAIVYIDRIVFNEDELTVAIRLEEVDLRLDGDAATPVAALIKSGALDLSSPGTLVGFMPNRNPVIAEAKDNRIVLDLMRDPKIGRNPMVRSAVSVLTSFVTLKNVSSDDEHLDVGFRAFPAGVSGAFRSFRRHVVMPSIGKFLPGGR